MVEAGLWPLLILTPLALGSVSERATALMEGGCFALLLLAWWAGEPAGAPAVPRGISLPVGLFIAWTVFQLVPLPPPLLKLVSPATERLYQQHLPGFGEGKNVDLQTWLLERKKGDSGSLTPRRGDRTGYEGKIQVRAGWRPISWSPHLTLRWLSRLLAYWALFLVVVRYLPEKACRKRLPGLLLVLGFAIAVEGVVQHLTWNGKIYWVIPVYQGFPFGPWVNSNHFSGYLEMVLPVGLGVLLQMGGWGRQHRRRRPSRRSLLPRMALTGFFLLCMFAAVGLAGSRGGIFALLLTAGIFLFAQTAPATRRSRHPRLLFLARAAPLLLLASGMAWYILHRGAFRPTLEPGVEPSFAGRVEAWKGTLAMVLANPLAGTGLGTFPLSFPLFKTYGNYGTWQQAHNDYLQLLAETGLVGFGVFLAALAFFLWRYLLPALFEPWHQQDPLVLGSGLSLAVLLLHSLVDFNLQIPSNGFLFVFLGGLLVRRLMTEPGEPAAP